MYVCLCNALTDADIRHAVHACDARRPADVFAACGCRAQCGTCVRTVCDMARREAAIAPLVRAASVGGNVADDAVADVPDTEETLELVL